MTLPSDTPPRILFMGTPDFAVPSLRALADAGLCPIAVATAPDRKRGRGQTFSPTPVKQAAQELGIETILTPEDVKDPVFAGHVRSLGVDVMVVVAFRILPEAVFSASRLGTFNLHGSLLPAYRGAAPINRAIMAGEAETGVTTFFLKQKVDTGNIIMKHSMPIGANETAGEVHDRMIRLGAEVVVETTRRILDGTAEAQPQDDSQASPAPKIFRDDCRIDWTQSAEQVHNLIRGVSPVPGAFTRYGGKQLKIFRSRMREGTGTSVQPGTILSVEPDLTVAAGSGTVILDEVQMEGRQRVSAVDFVNGHHPSTGTVLGHDG
ncbi:MAG: methionyl-tRNA formyltransferase [Bacteroidota bacterium]|nr:methionyl-tRNA formyltransferase [Bacteroidota bacterium]